MAQHQATGKGFSDEQRWCLAQMAAEHIAPTSSVRAAFDLATSDLDFLVEFDDLPPAEYADAYFSLKENLESLFGWWPLSPKSLENPNFRDRTYAERKLVYAC